MSNIVKRLIELSEAKHNDLSVALEAAEEIKNLRRALIPFAELWLYPDDLGFEYAEDIRADIDWDEDANDMQTQDYFILRQHIKIARNAIERTEDK